MLALIYQHHGSVGTAVSTWDSGEANPRSTTRKSLQQKRAMKLDMTAYAGSLRSKAAEKFSSCTMLMQHPVAESPVMVGCILRYTPFWEVNPTIQSTISLNRRKV